MNNFHLSIIVIVSVAILLFHLMGLNNDAMSHYNQVDERTDC